MTRLVKMMDNGSHDNVNNKGFIAILNLIRNFNPEKHWLELADGQKVNGVAKERCVVNNVNLTESCGSKVSATLKDQYGK